MKIGVECTSAGTSMMLDIDPGAGSSSPSNTTSLGNGEAVFDANNEAVRDLLEQQASNARSELSPSMALVLARG